MRFLKRVVLTINKIIKDQIKDDYYSKTEGYCLQQIQNMRAVMIVMR